jgi:malonate transporter and related proteins
MNILLIIIPIVLLVLTGFVFSKLKLFTEKEGDVLNKFVFNAAFPALVFDSIFHTPLSEILDWRLIVGFLFVTYAIFLAVFLIFKYGYKRLIAEATFAAMNASVSNTYLIALPILIALFGIKATVPVTVTAIVVMLFYVPVVTLLLEYGRGDIKEDEAIFLSALKRTLKNPLVVAVILGIIFSAFKITVPTPIFQWLRYIGATSIGLALITVGIELGDIKLTGKIKPVIFLTVVDLFINAATTCHYTHYRLWRAYCKICVYYVKELSHLRTRNSGKYFTNEHCFYYHDSNHFISCNALLANFLNFAK